DGNASYTAKREGMHGLEYSITIKIPAMSAIFLKPVNKRSPESDKPAKEVEAKPVTKAAEKPAVKAEEKPAAKAPANKANTANRKKSGKAKK
ncbi:MAG TPA: 1,4-alpha-glucan branching enzyme, partial [Ruminococcus sp.]|nr:1,4-alpha-glucan branching enzyme [Ruminococcus sp.]